MQSKFDEHKIRFLAYLNEQPIYKMVKKVHLELIKIDDKSQKTNSWYSRTKKLLLKYNIIENELKIEKDDRKKLIHEKIHQVEELYWRNALELKPKLWLYKDIKRNLIFENYFKSPSKKSTTIKFMLRSGTNQLKIDSERKNNIPKAERICELCKIEIEDEIHFTAKCPKLAEERQQMLINIMEIDQNDHNKIKRLTKIDLAKN